MPPTPGAAAALLLRRAGPLAPWAATRRSATTAATKATFYYQGARAPASLLSTGRVGTIRDGQGSDGEFFGVDPVLTDVEVHDGRGLHLTLDDNGCTLVPDPSPDIDYYDNDTVLSAYYPACEALVCRATGASFAVAFDHNVRARSRKAAGEGLRGGNAVQEPLITYGVHNDYTATSAPARIRQLAQPPRRNDTRQTRGNVPLLDPMKVEALLSGRWAFLNVWRNIAEAPVQRFPLGLCDATTAAPDDLVVFEIRYADRVGENYFARHSPRHRWNYFPQVSRDEAILLKCWDSRGRDFAALMPGPPASKADTVPATFTLHSAFVDPATPPDAPDRESIEVRTVAFFADAGS